MNNEKKSGLPWYKEGLRFECSGCGKCCTGASGFVWVTEPEMQAIADVLQIPLDLFKRKYTRQKNNAYSLIEKKALNGDFDCVFLKDNKCQVYQARPTQCKTFPWWPQNLNSEESWKGVAQECEGIHDKAPIIPLAHIEEQKQLN
jgi:Fe-S-cluster containining protein